jgi:hypothetical protein
MRQAENHPKRRDPAKPDGLLIAFVASVAVLIVGIAVVFFDSQILWPLMNLVVLGLPAAVIVIVLRESIRIAVARALGFRLFGVQWGAGASLLRLRIGGIHQRLGPIPIGADSRLASSRPGHHRLGRWCFCLAPALGQLLIAFVGVATGSLSMPLLSEGLAPVAMLHFANVTLLSIQLVIPFETETGVISDLRLMSVLTFSGIEDDRAARATALTMNVEQSLERGDVEGARGELDIAIAQLGREPMLIQLENRLERIGHSPEPSTTAKADAMSDPFDHPWTTWDRRTGPLSLAGLAMNVAFRAAPMAILTTIFIVYQYDALIHSTHGEWVDEAQKISLGRDRGDCETHLATYEARLTRLTLISKIPRPLQVRELRARSALNACTGDFERAIRDQALAVGIADTHRNQVLARSAPDSNESIEAELIHSSELRQLAAWHAARGAYREALRTTRRAEEDLERADRRTKATQPSPQREWALKRLETERQELRSTRLQILEDMDIRS